MRRIGACWLFLVLCATLTGCPPSPHYICFGDSVTQGAPEGSYPSFLEQLLVSGSGELPGCVANQGQFGEVACGSQGRLEERIDEALYPDAHTVLYWEGANDLMWYLYYNNYALDHGPTLADMEQIHHLVFDCIASSVEIIRVAGLEAYLGTYYDLVPGVNVFGWGVTTQDQIDFANQYVDALNSEVLSLADTEGIPVAPIHELGVLGDGSGEYYLEDGAHPNVEGYRLIAQVWYDAITAVP